MSRTIFKQVYSHNALSNRARRFREQAGAISWKPEPSSAYVKNFMDNCPSQAARSNNSTINCTDLTVDELRALRSTTAFTAPEKARKRANVRGKAQYKKKVAKLARQSAQLRDTIANSSTKPSSSSIQAPVAPSSAERYAYQSSQLRDTIANSSTKSTAASYQDPTAVGPPERYVYLVHGPQVVGEFTKEEAAANPNIDLTDPRHRFPTNYREVKAIEEALLPTAGALLALTGAPPDTDPTTSYIHQYYQIQSQLTHGWLGPPSQAPCLSRRGRWSGGIMDWRNGVCGLPLEQEDYDGTRARSIFKQELEEWNENSLGDRFSASSRQI